MTRGPYACDATESDEGTELRLLQWGRKHFGASTGDTVLVRVGNDEFTGRVSKGTICITAPFRLFEAVESIVLRRLAP